MSKKNKLSKLNSLIKRHKFLTFIIIIAAAATVILSKNEKKMPESSFATVEITRGNLKHVVTATGEIQPVNTVNVGSQVSGTIEKIYVDYNSKVKKDDILLTIEPSVLQASVDQANASFISTESQLNYAKNQYERNKTLYSDGFIARADLEQSQTNFETAQQAVKKAQSEYDRAITNLGYATIKSPVDGTVISRQVDRGQTIAASLQSPDLFEIAEDLSKMQIETSVSEADIGVIKENQKVNFTVDAYPTETFTGIVRQIRLSPTTTSNVVVYTVVINVENSDMKLMPGMTAFVTIVISEKENVLKASNAAFLLNNFTGIVDNPGNATISSHLPIEKTINNQRKAKLVPFKKGIVTATETEIISDALSAKDKIITGKFGQTNTNASKMGPGSGNKRPM